MEIKDLPALIKAGEECGLEFVRGKTKYKWYGTHVGDYPLPFGFTKDDLGKCEHVLRVKGNGSAYEIGITRYKQGTKKTVTLANGKTVEKDVSGHYALLWDFYAGGYGLVEKVGGQNASKLKQAYQGQIFKKKMALQGMSVNRRVVNGKPVYEAVKI